MAFRNRNYQSSFILSDFSDISVKEPVISCLSYLTIKNLLNSHLSVKSSTPATAALKPKEGNVVHS